MQFIRLITMSMRVVAADEKSCKVTLLQFQCQNEGGDHHLTYTHIHFCPSVQVSIQISKIDSNFAPPTDFTILGYNHHHHQWLWKWLKTLNSILCCIQRMEGHKNYTAMANKVLGIELCFVVVEIGTHEVIYFAWQQR